MVNVRLVTYCRCTILQGRVADLVLGRYRAEASLDNVEDMVIL